MQKGRAWARGYSRDNGSVGKSHKVEREREPTPSTQFLLFPGFDFQAPGNFPFFNVPYLHPVSYFLQIAQGASLKADPGIVHTCIAHG